jgi:hypothetical protein
MLLRMLVGLVGGVTLAPGDEAEFAEAEAMRLIDAGFAVPASAPIERAVRKPVETRKRK